MTKLWERLDAEAQTILCSPEGAEQWLLLYPLGSRHRVADATARALSQDVPDDISDEAALDLFSQTLADDLWQDALMGAAVLTTLELALGRAPTMLPAVKDAGVRRPKPPLPA